MSDHHGAACTECGNPLKDESLFCASCGARVQQTSAEGLHTTGPIIGAPQPPAHPAAPSLSPLPAGYVTPSSLPAAGQMPQAPAPAPARAGANTNRAVVIGVASALAAVLLVVAGIGVGAFFLNQNSEPSVAVAPAGQAQTTEAAAPAEAQSDLAPIAAPAIPTEAAPATQAPVVPQPAPQNQSVQSVTIRSESGNIVCRYHMVDNASPGVICQQTSVNYALPAAACKAGASGMVIGLTGKGTTYPCLAENIKGGETLRYDTPYTHAGVTCTISYTTGITCLNANEAGFRMEYDAGVSTF
ncbi:zinc ribbon domain-containing protein [Pseudoclavibacter helvolus]|uniref:Zinc-ribbon domain-containing protein n=1 Tax=Pseudoclavibacter helvolus TaxID=255205 RepID=A0A7W4UQX1_9MICO|nr:zinc-ribbon domain-containing protein [Pseudoclavibacter helvolus]MBB2958723.1 hypothetical protein [Pseudoclavibacter helvolus]